MNRFILLAVANLAVVHVTLAATPTIATTTVTMTNGGSTATLTVGGTGVTSAYCTDITGTDNTLVTCSPTTQATAITVANDPLTITLASGATANYAVKNSYSFTLKVHDGAAMATDTADIAITVNIGTNPIFQAGGYPVCVADGTAAGTTLLTVSPTTATTGDTVTYTINSGNTGNVFEFSSNVFRVTTGSTLTASTLAGYTVGFTGAPAATGHSTGTSIIYVTLCSCSSGSSAITASVAMVFTLLFGLLVKLF